MTASRLFLSLDGIDGTGKSTQVRLLVDWLREQGRDVVACVEPGGTPVGQELRQIVLSNRNTLTPECEAFLFMASRAQLVADVIRPALEARRTVVSDRFLLSTVVYQGHAGRLDVEQLWQVGRLSTGGLDPDLTLVLDLPVERAVQRRDARTADRMESKPIEYHRRVREGFLFEAARRPDRVRVIDASPAVEVVQAEVRRQVAAFLEESGDGMAARPRA